MKNEAFGVNAIVGYTFRSRHTTYSWEVTCYQRRDVPCKVWVEVVPVLELGLDYKMLKIRKKSAVEPGGHHDKDKRKSQLRNRRGHHVRAQSVLSDLSPL